jgi:hypothetical protein
MDSSSTFTWSTVAPKTEPSDCRYTKRIEPRRSWHMDRPRLGPLRFHVFRRSSRRARRSTHATIAGAELSAGGVDSGIERLSVSLVGEPAASGLAVFPPAHDIPVAVLLVVDAHPALRLVENNVENSCFSICQRALPRKFAPQRGPRGPRTTKAPTCGAFARCAEEDSNLHPVIPDQALNLAREIVDPSRSCRSVQIVWSCGRYGRIRRSGCCHGCCHEPRPATSGAQCPLVRR